MLIDSEILLKKINQEITRLTKEFPNSEDLKTVIKTGGTIQGLLEAKSFILDEIEKQSKSEGK